MNAEFQAVYDRVLSCGLRAEFREHEDRLVCAADGGVNWMAGPSVWIATKFTRWYISTWVPRIYEVPSVSVLGAVAVATMTHPNASPLYEIPADVRKEFGLRELTPAEVAEWLSDIVESDED